MSVALYLALLGCVALERGVELALSRRNAARAFARGGIEVGEPHFVAMRTLHTAFLVACAAEVILLRRPFVPALGIPMIGLVVAAQALRYWAVLTLGTRWNVRIIVVPGDAAITTGPYRYVRHPNYLAVVIEGVAIPLVHTAWATAVLFSVLNTWLLAVRIRSEEGALADHCDYVRRLGSRHRFVPTRWRSISTE